MKRIRPGQIVVWGVLAVIALAIAISFRPQPVPVDLAAVQRGALRVTIDEEGMTRVRDSFVVSSPVAGRLRRIELEPGDPVVAGKTAVASFQPATPGLLDPRTRAEADARVKAAQALREQARVAVRRTREELAYSQSELKRQRELEKVGGVTEQQRSAAAIEARTREAQVRAAELAARAADHDLEAARAALQQVTAPSAAGAGAVLVLRSPIDGVVLRRHHESETLVPAGEPLIEIGDPSKLEIVADLLSTDAVKVSPGLPAIIDRWGGEEALRGRVRLVEPSGFTKVSALGVEEQRVNVIIDLESPLPHGSPLGDGFRVEVSVIVWEQDRVLKVPTSSLFKTGDAWTVYAIRDGRAVRTTVRIGQRNTLEAEVLGGLAEGDRVIEHPGDTVDDGVRVAERVRPS